MANIGSFKKSGNEYQGEIVTLSVQTKGVRIVPEANRSNDNAPSHRVFVGRAEIGAAWSKRSSMTTLNRPAATPSWPCPCPHSCFQQAWPGASGMAGCSTCATAGALWP